MKTISFTVAQLTNGSQFAFIKAIIKAARKCEAVVKNANNQLGLLERMFAVEDDVMLRHAKSPLTAKIQQLDAKRDKLYRMVRAICKAMMEMMDADRKQAAVEVYDIIKAYGWIPTYKYDRQTGMLENLCQDLQGSHAHLVAQLGLTEAVANLKKANDDFAAFVAERSEAKGEFVRGEMAAARQDTEQAYYAMIEVVNSLSTLFMAGGGKASENPYADFINYANQEINRLKISELKQKTRSEEAESILAHQFGWVDPADGTDPDYPAEPGEDSEGSGDSEGTGGSDGTGEAPGYEYVNPDNLDPAQNITVEWLSGPEGEPVKKMVVPMGGQITQADVPACTVPGYVWSYRVQDINGLIKKSTTPGDVISTFQYDPTDDIRGGE